MKIIDTHIHGAMGVNFNTSSYEEIKILLKKLYQRGIIGICPTLVGDSREKLYDTLALFKKIKKEQSERIENEAFIIGVHLEGTFLNPEKPGIQDSRTFLKPTIENFKSIAFDMQDVIKIITLAPELDEGAKLSTYLEENNIRVHAGHTAGSNTGAASGTTHHFNAMPLMSHRGANIALDALLDDKIYTEIIADGIHVDKNMLKLFFKVKDHSKIILISDALPSSHWDREIEFCSKKITKDGRDKSGTIAGSVMLLDEIINKAVKRGFIERDEAEKFAFDNPVKHLQLSSYDISILCKI